MPDEWLQRPRRRDALVLLGCVGCAAVVILVAQGEAPQLESVHTRLTASRARYSRAQPQPAAPRNATGAAAHAAVAAPVAPASGPASGPSSTAAAAGARAQPAAGASAAGAAGGAAGGAAAAGGGAAGGGLQCHHYDHAGFDGTSFTWGMSFKTADAAECCDACRAHNRACGSMAARGTHYWTASVTGQRAACGKHGVGCNVFAYCPHALCWANDIHNHTLGECWLKHQPDPARPRSPAIGAYPEPYRKKHRTAPALVQWASGALLRPGERLVPDGPYWRY